MEFENLLLLDSKEKYDIKSAVYMTWPDIIYWSLRKKKFNTYIENNFLWIPLSQYEKNEEFQRYVNCFNLNDLMKFKVVLLKINEINHLLFGSSALKIAINSNRFYVRISNKSLNF
jgi:hypothetical protein